jgi:hypothetical protein
MSDENGFCDSCGQFGCTGSCDKNEQTQEIIDTTKDKKDFERDHKYNEFMKVDGEQEEKGGNQ